MTASCGESRLLRSKSMCVACPESDSAALRALSAQQLVANLAAFWSVRLDSRAFAVRNKQMRLAVFVFRNAALRDDSKVELPSDVDSLDVQMAGPIVGPDMSKLGVSVRLWIERLQQQSPSLHLEWLNGWRGLLDFLEGRVLKIGTMFSGCEVVKHVINAILHELEVLYNLKIPTDSLWMCEKSGTKQMFLRNQFSPDIIFRDAADMASLFSHNVVTGTSCAVPYVDVFR